MDDLKEVEAMAIREAILHCVEIVIVDSKVFNCDEDGNGRYGFCATPMREILYPDHHSDMWKIVSRISKRGKVKKV